MDEDSNSKQVEKVHSMQVDSLLVSLQMVCRTHGIAISKDALVAGLPLQDGRITPSLVKRAAERANLVSNVLKKSLNDLRAEHVPAILLLEQEEACLFLGWDEDKKNARVIFPELGEAEVLLPTDELQDRYTGYTIVAKPKFTFDAHEPLR